MHMGKVHLTVKVLMKKLGKNMHDTTKDAYTAVLDQVPSPSTYEKVYYDGQFVITFFHML